MTSQAKHSGEEPVSGDSKHLGLTKREYFAGLAMQGLLNNSNIIFNLSRINDAERWAVQCADTLLEELSK